MEFRSPDLERPTVRVEGASDLLVHRWSSSSALIGAVGAAYNLHLPLSLSPDHVWMAIAHGFAQHVKMNAEELRDQFVKFEGKQFIEVEAHDFVKGSPSNDWTRLFGDFSRQIEGYIGKKRDLLVCDFSTTGVVEKACSEIILMDAMSKYFDYGMRTMCGFPKITLEGEVRDWESILTRVENLREFGDLAWWLDPLQSVCKKLVETATGSIDVKFWRSFYAEGGGSGGPFVNGWVAVFYPFLNDYKGGFKRNWMLEGERLAALLARMMNESEPERRSPGMSGPNPSDFPSQVSAVPVKWDYLGQEFQMRFLGGLGAVASTPDGGVRPAAVWGILDVSDASEEQLTKLGL